MSAGRVPAPGELLAERYRIVRLIGEGGMGAVLEAENTFTHKRVAIKLLHPTFHRHGEAAQRLVREAQASCRIRHQNVVDIYDVVQEKDALFLIMQLLEGEPLSALLERGGVPAHEFIGLVLSAMRGVAAAHRVGVIHRDIHPGNILLAREPPSLEAVPKVLDFGIAKIRDDHLRSLTGSGVTMGTPLYMSYEQLVDPRGIDARTDVYAFGVILYQGLTGQTPFEASGLTELLVKLATDAPTPPKRLSPEIPTALDRLICWALHRDREQRIQSMDAFIDELVPFASARAFRTQMTDAQRTLPAIVPRTEGSLGSRQPPSPAAAQAEPARSELGRPAAAEEPSAEVAAARVPARAIDARAGSTRSTTRHVVSLLGLGLAAALAASAAAAHLLVRLGSENESAHRLPPPLPVVDAAIAPAARRDERVEVPADRLLPGPEALPRDAGTATIDSVDASAPPLRGPALPRADPRPEPPKRRFRAGAARPIDF